MTTADEIDVETVTPQQFARIVTEHKDKELRTLVRELGFTRIINQVFRFVPDHYRGGPDTASLQFVVTDSGEVAEHALQLDGPTCTHVPGRVEGPKATVSADAVSLCKLLTGEANEAVLLLRGRLKVSGDLMWARSVLQRFELPQA